MAKQVTTTLIDDLDGSKAVETVRFSVDGRSYQIDLSKKNAAALRKAIKRYVDHATPDRSSRPQRSSPRSARSHNGVDPRAVRAWASSRKIAVNARGRIRSDIIEQYLAEQ